MRIAAAFGLAFILCFLLTDKTIQFAEECGSTMQVTEAFIWSFGDSNSILLMSLLLLLLFADMPFITPAVVIAIVWAWIFDPNIGLANSLLKTNYIWLFDTHLAMPVLIFVSVWKLIGYNVILFLTGFASISPNVYEAAKIDGADEIQIFKNITLPLLKPTTYFVILVTAISSFQVFDLIYVMTSGGPNDATNVIVYSIYKYAFEYFDIGKSCALAYILFIIIFALAFIQQRLKKSEL